VKKLMISGAGKDRPGIVAAVTRVLYELKCNVEDTSMTRLEDHFALLMIVLAPVTVTEDRLRERLIEEAGSLGLTLDLHAIETARETPAPRGKTWMISVTGPDQTGIIWHVTRWLAGREINVQTLSSKRLSREGGDPLYLMSLEVEVPEGLPSDEVQKGLAGVARDARLEIHAEPLEEYTL
jgi:glycine cleavage system transcriptional repressor